jgi:hypothetical protein
MGGRPIAGRTGIDGSAGQPAADQPDSRRWLILGVIALAQLMVVLTRRS